MHQQKLSSRAGYKHTNECRCKRLEWKSEVRPDKSMVLTSNREKKTPLVDNSLPAHGDTQEREIGNR